MIMIINGNDNDNEDDNNNNDNFHVVARPWKVIYQGYTV